MVEWLYPAAVLLTGYLVLGITGFGSALVVVPLLAAHWPLSEVVALAILLDVPASMLHGGLNLKQVRWPELGRLMPGMAAGVLVGLWLLGTLDKTWPLALLGVYVLSVGVRALLTPRTPPVPVAPAWAHLAGALVGLVEVMFATAGPVAVAWFQKRQTDVHGLRATVPVLMVLAGTIAIVMLWGSGQVDLARIMPRWLAAMPVAAAGVVIGNRLAARIPPLLMRRLLAGLLAVSGLALMRHAWR
jgi:uncharacterized membrane protein YfcA